MRKSTCLIIALMIATSFNINAQLIISDAISVTDMDNSYGRKNPKIAVNANGEIIVFWMRTGNEAFFISTLSDGAFSLPVQIPFGGLNPDLWSGSLGPNMAAQGDDVYVTFEVYGDAIYVVHSSDGGITWNDPVAAFIPPAGRRATIPIIAVDGDGQPYIAYVNTNTSEGDARYGMVRSTDFGATFLDEVDVSIESAGAEVCECCNGHIAIADNGDVYVAFRNNDANLRDIWLARSTDGGETFSSAFDVDETDWIINACPTNGPHFSIVDGEIVTAFFSGAGSDGNAVYYSTFDTQNSIAGETLHLPYSNESSSNQNRPRVAGSGDTLAIVWQESFEGSTEIAMNVSTMGSAGLSDASFLLTDLSSNQQYPSILFSNAAFHVVYDDAASGTVMYQEVSFGTLGVVSEEKERFQIGPNPCERYLSIKRESSETSEITITDMLGRITQKTIIYGQSIQLDLSDLNPGLYFVSIDGERRNAQKLILQ